MPDEAGRALAAQLTRFWSSVGVTIRPGVSETLLAEFESQHDVVLPADMRGYLSVVDGMDDEVDDQRMIRFCPLADIKRVKDEFPNEPSEYADYFLFADFLLWSHGYAIRLSRERAVPNPVVIVSGGGSDYQVATSFSDFVARYLANDPVLLGKAP